MYISIRNVLAPYICILLFPQQIQHVQNTYKHYYIVAFSKFYLLTQVATFHPFFAVFPHLEFSRIVSEAFENVMISSLQEERC